MKEQYKEKSNKFYFSYSDEGGKGVDMNVQDIRNVYDIINEFEGFLKACGYISAGRIMYEMPTVQEMTVKKETTKENVISQLAKNQLMENKKEFDFSAIPNNSWLFSSQPLPALTTLDITAISTSRDGPFARDYNQNQYQTMAPLTTEQLRAFTTEMPGTLGYPKVKF